MQAKHLIYRIIKSSYGDIYLAEALLDKQEPRIVYCGFLNEPTSLRTYFPNAELVKYAGNENISLDSLLFPDTNLIKRLHFDGSPLMMEVWQKLLLLPRNKIISYSDLAATTIHPMAVRAVASCVGKNPISLIIPCHLVVRKEAAEALNRGERVAQGCRIADFGNYMWGKQRKLELINYVLDI